MTTDAPTAVDPGSAPTPSKSDIRPSVAWYWIGTAILVLGIGGATGWFGVSIATLISAPNDYERVLVPGERLLRFTEPGTYSIFGETSVYVYGGRSSLRVPEVTVKSESGTPIVITPVYSSGSSYTTGAYRGYELSTLKIPTAGNYTVTVGSIPGTSTGGTGSSRATTTTDYSYYSANAEVQRIAVGKSIDDQVLGGIFGSLALGSVSLLVGTTVLIVTGVKRSGSRRKLFPPAPRPMPYGPGPFAPGAYGGYPPPYPPGGYGAPGGAPGGYGAPGGAPGYGPPPGYAPPGYGPGAYPPPPGYGGGGAGAYGRPPGPGYPPPPGWGGAPGAPPPAGPAGGPPPPSPPPDPSARRDSPPPSGAPRGGPSGPARPYDPSAPPFAPPHADLPGFAEPQRGAVPQPPPFQPPGHEPRADREPGAGD